MSLNDNTNVSGVGTRIFDTPIAADIGWAHENDKERTITITLGEYKDMKKSLKHATEFRNLVRLLVQAIDSSEIAKDAEVIKALSFVRNY